VPDLPFTTRLWFAWVCFFRVLFDPAFAARAWRARAEEPALPPSEPAPVKKLPRKKEKEKETSPAEPAPKAKPAPSAKVARPVAEAKGEEAADAGAGPALQLLALFQREGRLIDFLEQDIAGFADAEIGAAARVVHEGCRKALRDHTKLQPVRTEVEGASLTLAAGYDPAEVKLTGNVQGAAPYKGVLRHRGWRASSISLPLPIKGHDARVLAPAEVEL